MDDLARNRRLHGIGLGEIGNIGNSFKIILLRIHSEALYSASSSRLYRARSYSTALTFIFQVNFINDGFMSSTDECITEFQSVVAPLAEADLICMDTVADG